MKNLEKEKYSKEEKDKAREISKDVVRMDIYDLEKVFWLMEGMKLARKNSLVKNGGFK